jgi:hypothetical protein
MNCILVSEGDNVFCCREQEEIMIAQHNPNGVAEASHESEKAKRFGPTIDEVPD